MPNTRFRVPVKCFLPLSPCSDMRSRPNCSLCRGGCLGLLRLRQELRASEFRRLLFHNRIDRNAFWALRDLPDEEFRRFYGTKSDFLPSSARYTTYRKRFQVLPGQGQRRVRDVFPPPVPLRRRTVCPCRRCPASRTCLDWYSGVYRKPFRNGFVFLPRFRLRTEYFQRATWKRCDCGNSL